MYNTLCKIDTAIAHFFENASTLPQLIVLDVVASIFLDKAFHSRSIVDLNVQDLVRKRVYVLGNFNKI